MKTLAKTAVHALVALGLGGAAVSPVLAENVSLRRTAAVSYAGIDLGTPEGQKILDKRIEKAVRHVCRTTDVQTGRRVMSSDALNCLAQARADAKRQLAAIMTNEQRGG